MQIGKLERFAAESFEKGWIQDGQIEKFDEVADAANAEDIEFLSHGVKVLVDPKSLPYLAGTELDYAREGLNEGFKFNNPNVKDACGCGESFNT